MESASFPEDVLERKVCVVGSEPVENYTVYIIEVSDGEHRWTVKHRYSDFHDLHEKLTAEKKVDRRLLPPKKMLGKNSKSLVERRQKELELYLQTLLQQFPEATPSPLACFLHFHLYEINGITAALAEELFNKGEQLLQAGEVFSLYPLQLYSVSQQLRLAKPTCCSGDAKTDLGHILDFTCRLRYLKVSGTRGPVGSSNIQESSLPFDLSVFKSLLQIEISECSSLQIRGLSSLRSSLATLSIHHSMETMTSILVPESSEFSQWEAEGAESGCPITAVIPVWRNLTTLDMSHNGISTIDSSVKLIPKVEFLDLSHNKLSTVENLQHLYNLVHVDLSYNCLQVLEAAHTRLGNIKTLSLAGNQLQQLSGLTKLYSLVNLDLSHNQLDQLEEIRNIGSLPCLEKLNLSSNPMCIIPDYRTKVLAQFGDRASEVCLDAVTRRSVRRPGCLLPQPRSDNTLPPVDAAPPPPSFNTNTNLLPADPTQVHQPAAVCCACCSSPSSRPAETPCFSCSAACCPLLPSLLLSLSSSNKDFITQLSHRLSSILKEQKREKVEEEETEEEREEDKRSKCRELQSHVECTEEGSLSPGSRDGYFEMGLDDSLEESNADQEQSVEEVLSSLQVDLLLPYSQLLLSSQAELPDSCLAFGLQAAPTRWFLFSEPEALRQTRSELKVLIQAVKSQPDPEPPPPPQLLHRSLINSWELEENIFSSREDPSLPSLLFLTHRHLWVLKIDFRELAEKRASKVEERSSNTSCPDPKHHHRRSHSVELLLGGQRLLLLFPLAQNRSSFLGELRQRRAALEGLKMVALPLPCPQDGPHTQGRHGSRDQCCCSSKRKSHSTNSWDSSRLQVEENQPSPHLTPSLSPGLKLLAGLGGEQLLTHFHRYIAESESEEVRQVLWLSVVLYKSPESELTCCLLLSNDTIYFLLEDSAATLVHHSVLDYFRVVGRSADHIVCCLSRDSYGTGVFLQELMSALSLQQQLPQPEPSDQDFYSQFTSTNTGKMQNYELLHSSRVKFIYPSEEEMGDLTFIVAERKTPASAASSSSRSFNVLLYLLVFQVQIPSQGSTLSGLSSSSSSSSGLCPVLQPRTLILTSTDVFLLDEDYVSYPLPDFAKEPPSRERYQLREARRIRDLDRVLLGYQTYPQALTLVFDDLPGPDLLCHLTMDHFTAAGEEAPSRRGGSSSGAEGEVQWCVFVPGADSRERLISLLARQWEALCSRELPVELTG
ncbi:hypothetical protein JOQ06_026788 [Pogonophryne albipinna]|uniref:PX domain-containing protein n=1 Tax=Pogonophryne albipinna TaxID=1090488 RepID=A0AAD6BBK5_9TELE|nr:hypothetical protein JOQ06_026788 [Pogonophryne albipinna]